MSFLATLAGRALGTVPVLRPRQPSRFEPMGPEVALPPAVETLEGGTDRAWPPAAEEAAGTGVPPAGSVPRAPFEGAARPRPPEALRATAAGVAARVPDGPEPTLAVPEPAPRVEQPEPMVPEPQRATPPPDTAPGGEASPPREPSPAPSLRASPAGPHGFSDVPGRAPASTGEVTLPHRGRSAGQSPTAPGGTPPGGSEPEPRPAGLPAPAASREPVAEPGARGVAVPSPARPRFPPPPDRASRPGDPEEGSPRATPAESPGPAAPGAVADWAGDDLHDHPGAGAPATDDSEPAVQVTIGKIELRTEAPPPPRPKPTRRRDPRLTLDGYLRRRSAGREREEPR